MKDNIDVDIILPNYNSSKFLEETIQSIINQDFSNWKLTIIDDCSDEKTKKILKSVSMYQSSWLSLIEPGATYDSGAPIIFTLISLYCMPLTLLTSHPSGYLSCIQSSS